MEFASEYYANNKPDVKIFGKQFSGCNNLVFKLILYKVSLNRLTTPFSKTWDKSILYLGEVEKDVLKSWQVSNFKDVRS